MKSLLTSCTDCCEDLGRNRRALLPCSVQICDWRGMVKMELERQVGMVV